MSGIDYLADTNAILYFLERRDAPLCSAFAGLVVLVGVGKEFIMKMIFALK